MHAPRSAAISTTRFAVLSTAVVIATTGGFVEAALASPGHPVLPFKELSDQTNQTSGMPAAVQTPLQAPLQTALKAPVQNALKAPVQPPIQPPVQPPLQPPAQSPLQASGQTSPSNSAAAALASATITSTNSPPFSHQLAQTEPKIPATDPPDNFLIPNAEGPALNAEDLESEVGDIQLLSRPTQQQTSRQQTVRQQPNGQLLFRSSAFTSSNVTGNNLTQTGDIVFVNQATFLATPKIGPDTRLVATASGGLTRFAEEGNGNNYNSLGFSLGVQQRFTPTTYGQLGWVNDQLYSSNSSDRTLTDNSARLLIGRQDQLTQKLRLDTTYELRARFTSPSTRSRIANSLGTRLRYDLSPDWQSTLGYRLTFNDYPQTGRFDTTHQIQTATTYTPTKNTFVSGFASYAFGRSSEAATDLENLSFGLGVGMNLPLF